MVEPKKTIFITGATSGFGYACARLFSEHGHNIIATGRRADRLDELAAHSPLIKTLELDVRDAAMVERAIADLPASHASVDVLVNNAGLALGLNSFDQQSPGDIEQMIDTNIKGVMHCTQALLPGMIARNRGHIVNISSIAGSYPYPGSNVTARPKRL